MADLKALNGVAEANLKTYNGLANANWKNWNGLVIPAGGDPHWASVVLLAMNENGADGTTAFDDASNSNHTITTVGNSQWDTAQKPTGLTSSALFDGAGDYLTVPDHADFELGSGDFTLEVSVRFVNADSNNSGSGLLAKSDISSQRAWEFLTYNDAGTKKLLFQYTTDGSSVVAVGRAWTPTVDTWYHVAVCRNGADLRLFVAGTQLGTTYDISTSTIFSTGSQVVGINALRGSDGFWARNTWMGSARITKAARYTADFTPSDLPYLTS